MKLFATAVLALTFVSTATLAQVNAGSQAPEPSLPFTVTQVSQFNLPWRIAVLPDGRLLITEKVGPVWLVNPTPQGQNGNIQRISVGNVPTVLSQGQGGMPLLAQWEARQRVCYRSNLVTHTCNRLILLYKTPGFQ